MSLFIKGMEMPPKGQGRMLLYDDNTAIWLNLDTGERIAYEVIPVPTPHGRLIDADALKERIAATYYSQDEKDKAPMDDIPWMNGCNTKVKEVCGMIDDAPTVIEAEVNE